MNGARRKNVSRMKKPFPNEVQIAYQRLKSALSSVVDDRVTLFDERLAQVGLLAVGVLRHESNEIAVVAVLDVHQQLLRAERQILERRDTRRDVVLKVDEINRNKYHRQRLKICKQIVKR